MYFKSYLFRIQVDLTVMYVKQSLKKEDLCLHIENKNIHFACLNVQLLNVIRNFLLSSC
jgi:hypothetical protein